MEEFNKLVIRLTKLITQLSQVIELLKKHDTPSPLTFYARAVRRFANESFIESIGQATPARDIRSRFVVWWVSNYPDLAVPSQKIVGGQLTKHGFSKVKRGGTVHYLDIGLAE